MKKEHEIKVLKGRNKREIKQAFIASIKVIRYKLSPKAADVLAELQYKHQYWAEQDRLINYKGRIGFYMSIDDIREETCLGKNAIQSSIKLLKGEGLIDSKRQGLTKPNIYFIDANKIDKYVDVHKEDYERWRLKIRREKVVAPTTGSLKEGNQSSGNCNSSILDIKKPTTTKNKITKNKKSKNLTNHINVGILTDLFDYADDLEEKIDALRYCDNKTDRSDCTKDIHKFLCNIVSKFKGFSMSEKDQAFIAQLAYDEISSWKVADKIISNALAIIDGRKESRFGNLFVGVNEMIEYRMDYE